MTQANVFVCQQTENAKSQFIDTQKKDLSSEKYIKTYINRNYVKTSKHRAKFDALIINHTACMVLSQ